MPERKSSTRRVREFRARNTEKHRVEILLTSSEAGKLRLAAKRWRCTQQDVLRLVMQALEPVLVKNLPLHQLATVFFVRVTTC